MESNPWLSLTWRKQKLSRWIKSLKLLKHHALVARLDATLAKISQGCKLLTQWKTFNLKLNCLILLRWGVKKRTSMTCQVLTLGLTLDRARGVLLQLMIKVTSKETSSVGPALSEEFRPTSRPWGKNVKLNIWLSILFLKHKQSNLTS